MGMMFRIKYFKTSSVLESVITETHISDAIIHPLVPSQGFLGRPGGWSIRETGPGTHVCDYSQFDVYL